MPRLIATLLLVLVFAAAAAIAGPVDTASTEPPVKVVYHLSDADKARPMLNNVRNHLNADPTAQIVVVGNAGGIDFMLREAVDKGGNLYAPAIEELAARGVAFRACRNTLNARHLTAAGLVEEATVIASGVAEVARLQAREGYVYVKP